MTLTADRPMAKAKGRPKKPGGEGAPVRVDNDIYARVKYLAALEGIPVQEYVSSRLRPIVDREFRAAGRRLDEGPSKPEPPRGKGPKS